MGYIGIPRDWCSATCLYVLDWDVLIGKHVPYIRMREVCRHIAVNLLCMIAACGVGWLGLRYFSYDYGFVQNFCIWWLHPSPSLRPISSLHALCAQPQRTGHPLGLY